MNSVRSVFDDIDIDILADDDEQAYEELSKAIKNINSVLGKLEQIEQEGYTEQNDLL